ncbi:hypothetical protein ABNF97_14265 [Plantactinospora sp. B6F1]|uniref:hypothetical protein n=1 Tax=Plantactinospora sp. B6F1 TaxID=3158971 RepID=UPI00102BF37F
MHEIREFVRDARAQFEAFISAVEWLVDYPLRHVESSKWDSFTGTTTIDYRELMGAHNVVAVKTEATQGHMEAGSTRVVLGGSRSDDFVLQLGEIERTQLGCGS